MAYKIEGDLLEKGTRELIRLTINNLESAMENKGPSDVGAAVEFCYSARNAAILALIDHTDLDFYLSEHSKELKQRFGVDIR